MLCLGFYPDMQKVQRYLPDRSINSCMFSATFPSYVMRTAREFIREPEFISLSKDHVHVTDTEHVVYVVPGMDKDRAMVRIIEIENPDSAIIFCNTKASVHYVSVVLQRFGLLALFATIVVANLLGIYPLTTDFSAPYFPAALFGVVLALALAVYGFRTATAGQQLFSDSILEEPART